MGLSKFISFNILRKNTKNFLYRSCSKNARKPPWKVLFFGADDFSVFSLKALTEE